MSSNSKEIEELSGGWVLCRSKSNRGRQYYFNRKTGKSSWTPPQPGIPSKKLSKKEKAKANKEREKANQEKKKREEVQSKTVKRKSDGFEAGTSNKKHKHVTPEKHRGTPSNKKTPTKTEAKIQARTKHSPSKCKLTNNITPTSTPAHNSDSVLTSTPIKNSANKRLSQLRAQLSAEANTDNEDESLPKKRKCSPQPGINDTPVRPKNELPSPNLGESLNSTRSKSPSSDSFQSIPSPSQFFAANKILCSMKAQLPDEFCNKEKPKDTFADIEHGICNQMTEYPLIKHPATPPQFSEASKLVSAIKSKLTYKVSSPKEIKTYSSAMNRMEALRASVSAELDDQNILDDSKPIDISPQKCEAMEVEDIKEIPTLIESLIKDKDTNDGQVVLVVDTNIFIHELDFINKVLSSHIKGYSEQPRLLVPWRVINELDRLKDNNNGNGAVCKRARAAMDYLYKYLPENNRIKGQSLRDANSHIYPCEVPDDEILNCSLQQAERGRNVLLLSNDRNLCNKASINGIKRFSVTELKALIEHKPQPIKHQELLAHYKHYKHTIYQLLANILENEMRANYNNLWQHVLFKAPPWQLSDVLECLLKHWVAVFNEVFPRIKHLIIDLNDTYRSIESKDQHNLTPSEVSNFKDTCLDVARKCQIIPEYMELAKLTMDRLTRTSEMDEEQRRQIVVGVFEALWTVMSSYCAKLSTAVGISHTLEDNLPGTDELSNLTNKFTVYSSNIVNLTRAIEGVLNIEDTSSMEEKTARLHAAVSDCSQLAQHAAALARDHLREFCVTNRNMLQEAMAKFSQLVQLLDACKNNLASSVN